MKRIREETIIENNYFFPVIIEEPRILIFIFEYLELTDLLTIYKILSQYFVNIESVMIILDNYLEENYFINLMNTNFFKQKVKKLSYLVETGDIDTYANKINKYKIFRNSKNFIKYGLCNSCHCIPDAYCDKIDFVKVCNRNINELECKVIYNCINCNIDPVNNLFYSSKQFINEIGVNHIACFYADHFGIRFDWQTPRFYRKDYFDRVERKKQIDNIIVNI